MALLLGGPSKILNRGGPDITLRHCSAVILLGGHLHGEIDTPIDSVVQNSVRSIGATRRTFMTGKEAMLNVKSTYKRSLK
jgi:hypothetical protein